MRRNFLLAAIVILFLAHSLFYVSALGYDAVDDAYISFRYAQNAILGHGLVFNPGERVEGFTNFLWTALMTPLEGARGDVGRLSMALGFLFSVVTLWLTTRLANVLLLPPAVGLLAAALLAADGSFAIWSVGGLETALFAFLITAGAWFYVREQYPHLAHQHVSGSRAGDVLVRHLLSLSKGEREGVPVSAVFFALATMTRPEAAFVFALTVAHQFVWRILSERRLFRRLDLARIFLFAALFVPYWLGRWRYYHSFFPNSFYAKVAPGGPAAQIERGWHHLNQFIDVHLGWWILLPAVLTLVIAFARHWRVRAVSGSRLLSNNIYSIQLFGFSYLTALIVVYAAYIVYVGGDWSVGRFFVPLLPATYLLIAAGLFEISRYAERTWRNRIPNPLLRRASAMLALILALAISFASSWNGEYGIYIRSFEAARATEARVTMGRWLKANVPRETWIAVDAAGQVPYFSELPALDMFGINDLHIGRLNVATLGEGTPGHEKFDLGYVLARAPRFVIIYGNLFDAVTEYRRANVEWTNDEELKKFLTLYEVISR